jgi:hypothetical protein
VKASTGHPVARESTGRGPLLALIAVVLSATACVHLPSGIRSELDCDAATASRFGGERACAQGVQRRKRMAGARATTPAISAQDSRFTTGQIILIERPGPVSLFLSLMADRFAPYIHAGLIVFDDGKPYVYEAFGIIKPRLSGNPAEGMGGGVRRVTLRSFLKRGGIIAVVDPPPEVDRTTLADYARQQRRLHTPFDGQFDSSDPSRFYCVEFVAHALEAAGTQAPAGAGMSSNRSMRAARQWLGTSESGLLLAGELMAPERRVLLVSRRYSQEQIHAYFELKRELHARFTPEQKLGALLRWQGQTLRYRAPVQEYFDAGLADDAPDVAILAARIFDSGMAGR